MAETLRNLAGNVIMLRNKSRWIREPSKPMDSRAEQRGWREQIEGLAHSYQEVYQPSNNESWGMGYWKGIEFALDCSKEEIAAAEARGRLDAAREIGLAASGAGLKVEHLERYEDWHAAVEFLQFHAEALGREQVLSHTGFLRQWLNERPSGSLVVDAELRHWLEFGLKQAFPTKPDRQTFMGYKVEVDENLNGNEWHLKSSPTQGSSNG